MNFPIDMQLASKAFRLSMKGLKGKEMSLKLSTKAAPITADDANLLAAVGAATQREDDAKLTDRERAILLALAAIQRERRANGETGSPKGKHIAWRLRLSEGQVSTATKRIREREYGAPHDAVRLSLLSHSLNGHIWLRPAGWAVVHALEAAEAAHV